MIAIRSGALYGAFRALGLAGPGLGPGQLAVNLCPSRVRAIAWSSGARIEEAAAGGRPQWRLTAPQNRDLAYLDVERWLSRHCVAVARPAAPGGAYAPFWTFEYVDGSRGTLDRSGVTNFRWNGVAVESRDLQRAAIELAGVAGLESSQ